MSDTGRDKKHEYAVLYLGTPKEPQRKFQRGIPDELQVARDVPKTPKQATGYLSLRQAKDGAYAVNVVGNVLSTNYRIASLNELLTFVGDWASGQYNEVKE